MNSIRAHLLGPVRLGQLPSWGPAYSPAPMLPMATTGDAAGQNAPTELPVSSNPSSPLTNTLYVGGAVVAVMAAIGAFFA
jgi:hypothetical protein